MAYVRKKDRLINNPTYHGDGDATSDAWDRGEGWLIVKLPNGFQVFHEGEEEREFNTFQGACGYVYGQQSRYHLTYHTEEE